FPELQARPGALEQVMIELTAADPIADRLIVARDHFRPADHAGAETGERFQRAPLAIIVEVDSQFIEYRGRNPTGAGLIAREGLAIEDDRVEAETSQFPGASGPCRTAANNQRVARDHGVRPLVAASAERWSRVHGMAF